MRSALIIGGDGTIGSALKAELHHQGLEVHATSHSAKESSLTLDLAKPSDTWPILPKADAAYLCAAVTKLDTCEDAPELTARVNVLAMQELATRLMAQGTQVIFLSSNQVFDGTKSYRHADESTCPLNEYGRQKAMLEAWLQKNYPAAAILRLTKVISARLSIVEKWETALKQGTAIEAFDDLIFAPLPLAHVLKGLMQLGQEKRSGIFQLSGTRDVSYYAIACALAERLKADASAVISTSAKTAGIRPQFLPMHGTLKQSEEFAYLPAVDPLEALLP